jgi:COP9 signalosome complex subunit 2
LLSLTLTRRAANRETIMDDPFIRFYIDDVLRSLRTQWILEIIKPYNRIEIAYLARVSSSGSAVLARSAGLRFERDYWLQSSRNKADRYLSLQQLGIPDEQVEEIVVSLILDEKVHGRIDQVSGRLDLDRQ